MMGASEIKEKTQVIDISGTKLLYDTGYNRLEKKCIERLKESGEPMYYDWKEGTDIHRGGNPREVYWYTKDGKELLMVFESTTSASKYFMQNKKYDWEGMKQTAVSRICWSNSVTANSQYYLRFKEDLPVNLYENTEVEAWDLSGEKLVKVFPMMSIAKGYYSDSLDKTHLSKTVFYDKGVQLVYAKDRKHDSKVKRYEIYGIKDTVSDEYEGKKFYSKQEIGKELGVSRELVRVALKNKVRIKKRYSVEVLN